MKKLLLVHQKTTQMTSNFLKKKRNRPVSSVSTFSGITTKNSFSVLQESPEKKKRTISNKGNYSPSSPLSCRPKDKVPSKDLTRSHSCESMKSFGSDPVAAASLEPKVKNSGGTKKSNIDVDMIMSQLITPDDDEEPSSSKLIKDKKSCKC